MATRKKKLPLGIENFEELQSEEFYCVDKTNLIKEFLEQWTKVTPFTRPRRFGRSLHMSMLKNFFELGGNKKTFENLAISKESVLCEEYMGKFPVIFVSLKGINAENYEKACDMAVQILRGEASEQIAHKRYEEELLDEGMENILKYGIAFHDSPVCWFTNLKKQVRIKINKTVFYNTNIMQISQ